MRERYCGLCSVLPNTGLIIFLCQSIAYDLSSKERRFNLFRKSRGLKELPYHSDDEESLISFRDLTKEHKAEIYGEFCSHFLDLNQNEFNNLSNKMIGLIKKFFL